jgi:3-oxoacyl-[acyl-carrier protein] reductase
VKLEGKTAVVTGAGQGIGRAIALTLAREGADVAIYDLNLDSANGVADEVKALGRQALAIKCDVSRKDDVTRATEAVLEKFRKIDILVNNAGITVPELVMNTPEELWDRNININLKSQFLCCQTIGRHMIEQKSGRIINIGSVQALVSNPYLAVYAASKGGVLAFTRGLATELAAYNINVNMVSPGVTQTPMHLEVGKTEPLEDKVARTPLQRFNQPEDIANAVQFFATNESRQITGQHICVDSGLLALHPGYVWPKDWPPKI